MRSGCVPCNPSTNPVIPDAFHMRSSFLSKVSQKITCVPYAFHETPPKKEQTIIVPVCVPMRSAQPFRKSVKQQCVPMNSDCVPYTFLIVFKVFVKTCMRSYAFRATVTQFVNITNILLTHVSFSLRGVPVTRHPSQQGHRSTMLA